MFFIVIKKIILLFCCGFLLFGCDISEKDLKNLENIENLDEETLQKIKRSGLENINLESLDLEDLKQLEQLEINLNLEDSDNLNDFAKCLSEKNFSMFGTNWCSHCNAQKQEFGKSFQFIDFVNCEQEFDKCKKNGIPGYPTWKTGDGKLLVGKQKLEILAKESGCQLF